MCCLLPSLESLAEFPFSNSKLSFSHPTWGLHYGGIHNYIPFMMPQSKAEVRSMEPFSNRTSQEGNSPLVELGTQDTVRAEDQMDFTPCLAHCPSPPPLTAPAGFILSFSCLSPWRDWDCGSETVVEGKQKRSHDAFTRGRQRHQVPNEYNILWPFPSC